MKILILSLLIFIDYPKTQDVRDAETFEEFSATIEALYFESEMKCIINDLYNSHNEEIRFCEKL